MFLFAIKLEQCFLLAFTFCPGNVYDSKPERLLFSGLDGKWYLSGQLNSLAPQNSLTLFILSVVNDS